MDVSDVLFGDRTVFHSSEYYEKNLRQYGRISFWQFPYQPFSYGDSHHQYFTVLRFLVAVCPDLPKAGAVMNHFGEFFLFHRNP